MLFNQKLRNGYLQTAHGSYILRIYQILILPKPKKATQKYIMFLCSTVLRFAARLLSFIIIIITNAIAIVIGQVPSLCLYLKMSLFTSNLAISYSAPISSRHN